MNKKIDLVVRDRTPSLGQSVPSINNNGIKVLFDFHAGCKYYGDFKGN